MRDTSGSNNNNWRGGIQWFTCSRCQQQFSRPRAYGKRSFCSRSCAAIGRWDVRGRLAKVVRKPMLRAEGAYCLLYRARCCGHLTKKGRSFCGGCSPRQPIFVSCVTCGNAMRLAPSAVGHTKTCSKNCSSMYRASFQRGPLSHRWRGGLTEKKRIQRNSAEYAVWRRSVFDRDNYTCVNCGHVGGRLAADHIKPWALFPALRFELSNGRTLCWPCHRRIGINPGQMNASQKAALLALT